MPESSCFKTPFRSQRVNGSQALLKPARQRFYPNFLLMSDKLGWKTSFLGKSKILELVFNKFAACYMYSCQN